MTKSCKKKDKEAKPVLAQSINMAKPCKKDKEVKPVLVQSTNMAKPCKKKDKKVKPVLAQSTNMAKPCKKKDKEVKSISVQSINSKAVGVQNTKPTQMRTTELKIPEIKPRKTKVSKALSDSNRRDLERKMGHTFHDPNLLWEALQAHGNGVVQIGERKIEDGNKKMAMLGDTILQLALLNDWFDSGTSRSKSLAALKKLANQYFTQNQATCFYVESPAIETLTNADVTVNSRSLSIPISRLSRARYLLAPWLRRSKLSLEPFSSTLERISKL
jgi:hypothetical protein